MLTLLQVTVCLVNSSTQRTEEIELLCRELTENVSSMLGPFRDLMSHETWVCLDVQIWIKAYENRCHNLNFQQLNNHFLRNVSDFSSGPQFYLHRQRKLWWEQLSCSNRANIVHKFTGLSCACVTSYFTKPEVHKDSTNCNGASLFKYILGNKHWLEEILSWKS